MGIESNIKAMTGFQMRGRNKDELVLDLIKVLSTADKKIEYVMESLTSSKEIYKHGGHVVMKSRDQIFRLHYDNRRRIMSEDVFEATEAAEATKVPNATEINKNKLLNSDTKTKTDPESKMEYNLLDYTPIYSGESNNDKRFILLDSRPVANVVESKNYRYLMKLSRNSAYNIETSGSTSNSYRNLQDKIVRCFLKGLLHTPPMYNLNYDFSSYTGVINYLKEYDPTIKLTRSSISNLKNRKMIIRSVPRNGESLAFVEFVKIRYPNFDGESFLGK